jgi:hypothetical protein
VKGSIQQVRRDDLVRKHPTLYHMAEDGTWPSIQAHGLLSTQALVDLYNPEPDQRDEILAKVRRASITLTDPSLGHAVIRDQRPLKFLNACLLPDTSPQQFLDALNGRVFFWLTRERLTKLLGAKLYRQKQHSVLHVDTRELMLRYGDVVQLAPYNTGSMHVPTAPRRGSDVFVDIDRYPYDAWRAKRGKQGDAVVELTVPYAIPDIAQMTVRVERWHGGEPVETLLKRDPQ